MRADVANVVGAQREVVAELLLNADIHLLDHRILEIVVDDVDASGACARQNKTCERIRERRRAGRKHAVDRIEKKLWRNEKQVSGAHFNGQRATIESAFQRLDLE